MTPDNIVTTSKVTSKTTNYYARDWICQISLDNAKYFVRLCQNYARKFLKKLHQKSTFARLKSQKGSSCANISLKIML